MHTGAGFIHYIDRLVWKKTVGDIAITQLNSEFDTLIRVPHIVMLFIFILDVVEDGDRFFRSRGINNDLLETPVESTIFLDVLTIFIKCCGTNTLYFATRKGGLEHI